MPDMNKRRLTDPFVAALQANTAAILALESRFNLYCQVADQHDEKLKKIDATINGNGKSGMKSQVQKLELYATLLIGLFGAGVIGVITFLIVRGVQLIYTLSVP